MSKLREELVNLFNIDVFRRFIGEYVIPIVMLKLGVKIHIESCRLEALRKKDDDLKEHESDNMVPQLSAEAGRAEYEMYDDYLEMMIEMGYICLFATAYPSATIVAIFSHHVEVRSDCLQITRVYRKMRVVRTNSIGTWNFVMSCIVWMSALTNCVIFAYTSHEMVQYVPGLFDNSSNGKQGIIKEKEWMVLGCVLGAERLLLLLGILIRLIMSQFPSEVSTIIEHQAHIRMKEARMLRHLQIMESKNSSSSSRCVSIVA